MASQKNREIGARVRAARKKAGLSQAELADLCDVTQATVQKIETGRSANSRFLPQIWFRLGLPLDELEGFRIVGTKAPDVVGREQRVVEIKSARPGPRSLSAAADQYQIRWQNETPTWQAFDVIDLHYGRAISEETGREGLAMMWRLRDGSYLIGVMDAETAERTLPANCPMVTTLVKRSEE